MKRILASPSRMVSDTVDIWWQTMHTWYMRQHDHMGKMLCCIHWNSKFCIISNHRAYFLVGLRPRPLILPLGQLPQRMAEIRTTLVMMRWRSLQLSPGSPLLDRWTLDLLPIASIHICWTTMHVAPMVHRSHPNRGGRHRSWSKWHGHLFVCKRNRHRSIVLVFALTFLASRRMIEGERIRWHIPDSQGAAMIVSHVRSLLDWALCLWLVLAWAVLSRMCSRHTSPAGCRCRMDRKHRRSLAAAIRPAQRLVRTGCWWSRDASAVDSLVTNGCVRPPHCLRAPNDQPLLCRNNISLGRVARWNRSRSLPIFSFRENHVATAVRMSWSELPPCVIHSSLRLLYLIMCLVWMLSMMGYSVYLVWALALDCLSMRQTRLFDCQPHPCLDETCRRKRY